MALYKDYTIKGATITVNMEDIAIAVSTDDAVWLHAVNGAYLRVGYRDGDLVTDASLVRKEGSREQVSVNWLERVTTPLTS